MAESTEDAIVPILRAIQTDIGEMRSQVTEVHKDMDEIKDAMSGMMWMLAQNLGRTNDHEDRIESLEASQPTDS